MWHILLPIQIRGKHIIVMSTPSNIISCSIILTNSTLLFGASPLCNVALLYVGISKSLVAVSTEVKWNMYEGLYESLFGWVLGGTNQFKCWICWAELGEESCVQLQESKIPTWRMGCCMIILFHLLLLHLEFWEQDHYSNLPLTLAQKRRQRHQLWFTCHSSLCSFEVN